MKRTNRILMTLALAIGALGPFSAPVQAWDLLVVGGGGGGAALPTRMAAPA